MTGSGAIDAATLDELLRLARSQPRSERQAQAKASALRTLERLNRRGRVVAAVSARLAPGPAALQELDRVHLEEHAEVRQRMLLVQSSRRRGL